MGKAGKLLVMKSQSRSTFSRRGFLKKTALGGAAALAAPSIKVLGANDVVRVAVIGVGGRGASHIKSLRAIEGVEVVAVCDPDAAKMNWVRKDDPKVEQIEDFREVLDRNDIDAVTTAAPNHWHAAMTVMGCQAGKHVYVESRLATVFGKAARWLKLLGSMIASCKAVLSSVRVLRRRKWRVILRMACMAGCSGCIA